jgi:hypothetical protein
LSPWKEHYGTSRISSSALALSHTQNLYNQNLFKFLCAFPAWHIVWVLCARQLHRYLLNFSSLAHLPGPLVLSGQASELYWVTTHINTHTDTHFGPSLVRCCERETDGECGYWILQQPRSPGISDLIRFYCVALSRAARLTFLTPVVFFVYIRERRRPQFSSALLQFA